MIGSIKKLKACVCKFILLVLPTTSAISQIDTTNLIGYSGYGELYYSYDFANPQNHEKPDFIYNHKRHNEFNANLLLAQVHIKESKHRANIGLMAGNYPQYNLISEPTWAQFMYQANIGIKLSNTKNIWLDAGILPSHIGFESAIGTDCWTLTRSLVAENSPYYETGVKLSSQSKDSTWYLAALILNGWQRVQKPNGYQLPSAGIQISYNANKNLLINYSNFIGSTQPDSLKSLRHYHNIYVIWKMRKSLGLTIGFDMGQEKSKLHSFYTWYTPVIIAKYKINENLSLSARTEYYYDKHGVMINSTTANGFQTFGYSANFDYVFNPKVLLRVEGKLFNSKDAIFSDLQSHHNYSVTTSISIKL